MNTYVCPWCSYPLLRQVRLGKPSWFCIHCNQDIPYSCNHTIVEPHHVEEILKRYKLLTDNIRDIVLFVQQDGQITEANHAACQAYGYEYQELLSLKIQDLQAPGSIALLTEQLAKADSQAILLKTEHRRQDGSTFPVEVNLQSLGIGEDRIISIIRDLTEQKHLENLRQVESEKARLLAAISQRIYQSLNLNEILSATVTEVREFLKADRVIIHHFLPNWDSSIIVEAVTPDFPAMMGFIIHDPFILEKHYLPQYQQGESRAIADINTSGLDRRLTHLLTFFQVKARLAVPILKNTADYASQNPALSKRKSQSQNPLWGLLIAHQCSGSREWQPAEIELLNVVATQVAIAIQQSKLHQQLQEAQHKLQQVASLDSFTLLASRSEFNNYLESEWEWMAQEESPLSLILCNIDFFQAYNDHYGYEAGDLCLKEIAKTLRSVGNRPQDLVARYSSGELALILPRRTRESTLKIAEEIRFRVKQLEINHAHSPLSKYLTVSLGVASAIPDPSSTPIKLIADATSALYQAKEFRGRGYHPSVSHLTLLKPQFQQPTPLSNVVPLHQPKPEIATNKELLISYVAYYVSRGQTVFSPLNGPLPFTGLVYEYWGYHSEFKAFWNQLEQRRDFPELYLEGEENSFSHFLGGRCGVGECARCNLPIPISEGAVYTVPNCTLCDSDLRRQNPEPCHNQREIEREQHLTKILAIGAPPSDYRNLKKLFLLNGFEVSFARNLDEISPELLPSGIDMVLIYAPVSEAEGKAWAKQLRSYPRLEGVPVVALSTEARFSHPWVQRQLGMEDYILAPLGGDRLANHLRRIEQLQLLEGTAALHWFPG